MKIADRKIHQLIHSMSRHEKIYFKRMSARSSEGKAGQYVELFDAIAAQQTYDEAALIEAFKDRKFVRQFAVMKKYLYDQVMRSLVDQRRKKELSARLEDMKWEANILWERGMYKEAQKLFKKAREKAKAHDLMTIFIDLMLSENYLTANAQDRKEQASISFLLELENAANALYQQSTYMRLYESFMYWHRRERALRSLEQQDKLKQLMQEPLLLELSEARTFLGSLLFNTIHEKYQMMTGNLERATAFSLKNLQLYEAYPKLKVERGMNYFVIMISYLNNLYRLKEHERLREELERFSSFTTKDERLRRYFFARFNVLKLVYCELSGDYADFEQIKLKLEAEWAKPIHQLPATEWRLLLYNMLKLQIMQGIYEEAQDSILKLNQLELTERQADLQRFSDLLEILIHYKLGNEQLIDYLNLAAKRQMQRKKELYEYESLFSSLFRKLIQKANYERKELLQNYLSQLEALYEEESAAFEYFDLILWIRAELNGSTMAMEQNRSN